MGEAIQLELQTRTVTGKKVKKLRQQGIIPAVLYGHDMQPVAVSGPAPQVTKAYVTAGKRLPLELTLDGKPQLAMIKQVDMDPVKHQLRNIEFHAIKQGEKVTTEVPIRIANLGETAAEKAGLIILTSVDQVEIEALPNNLPEALEVPSDKLLVEHDHVTVADIAVPKGVVILSDPEQAVATVYEPSALQAANDAAGGDAEEPTEEPPTDTEGESVEDAESPGKSKE